MLLAASTLAARDDFGYDGDADHTSPAAILDNTTVTVTAGTIDYDSDPYESGGTGGGASHSGGALPLDAISASSSSSATTVQAPAQSVKPAMKQPPVILSWECQPDGYGKLKINDTSFGPEAPADLLAELDAAYKLCDRGCVEVHLPLMNKEVPVGTEVQRLPYLQGSLQLVFQKLTSPEKDVNYFYNGKPVRRYLITCSDKNTRNDATCAEYWLDGESLGCWPEAIAKLQQIKWQRYAVADVTVDFTHPLNASGMGFTGLPKELQKLLNEHDVATNIHVRYRAEMGR